MPQLSVLKYEEAIRKGVLSDRQLNTLIALYNCPGARATAMQLAMLIRPDKGNSILASGSIGRTGKAIANYFGIVPEDYYDGRVLRPAYFSLISEIYDRDSGWTMYRNLQSALENTGKVTKRKDTGSTGALSELPEYGIKQVGERTQIINGPGEPETRSVAYFIKRLSKLNRASYKGSKAPHKPILLLSVIQAIEYGEIKENKISITAQLVARYKDNWTWLVKEDYFKPNFALPFYHLHSDKLWHLHIFPGRELMLTSSSSVKSLAALHEAVAYASLDEGFYLLLRKEGSRKTIYQFLLEHYFPNADKKVHTVTLFEKISKEVLNDQPAVYRHKAEQADEEELFIRGGVFKRVVPQIYNYTCAISGLRIHTAYDIQLVDACHIIPFSQTHDDTISNGISLCPNLHRAFDHGLLSINEDYRVLVSGHLHEHTGNTQLTQYHLQPILLPENPAYQPSEASLRWHRERVFKS